MLKHIFIANYALIDVSQVDISKGFTVVTGETGSGKSIFLDALSILLGARADRKIFKEQDKKCIIEAHFQLQVTPLLSIFEQLELDFEETTIIRREILPSGKSRIFVNDTPTTLEAVKQLSKYLIDIHTQHETSDLFQASFQEDLLDVYANNTENKVKYVSLFDKKSELENTINQLTNKQETNKKELDYKQFLLEELNQYPLEDIDLDKLNIELKSFENQEEIQEKGQLFHQLFQAEQIGLENTSNEMYLAFQKLKDSSPDLNTYYTSWYSSYIEFLEQTKEVVNYFENLSFDQEKINELKKLYNSIQQLLMKHAVNSSEELIKLRDSLEIEINEIVTSDTAIIKLQKELSECELELKKIAKSLTEKRVNKAPRLETKLKQDLVDLGLEEAEVSFQFIEQQELTKHGNEKIELHFSANKGRSLQPLSKVASGGELARLMLVLKNILADFSQLSTIIFDEIDTGVSGRIAEKIGDVMHDMGTKRQVISLTHLPQVASKGDTHFKVTKETLNGKTSSKMQKLNHENRIQEIAQMLSGEKITSAALEQAKELVNG